MAGALTVLAVWPLLEHADVGEFPEAAGGGRVGDANALASGPSNFIAMFPAYR